MELEVPVSVTSQALSVGQFAEKGAENSVQQDYLDQWHLLENLQADLQSEEQLEEQRLAKPAGDNTASNADTDLNQDDLKKKESEQWFVLGEDPLGVGPEVQLDDEQAATDDSAIAAIKQEAQKVEQMSAYTEQWYELEQLKASVRSLGWAAGLSPSPQPSPGGEDVVSGTMSSGSLSSTETEDEAIQESLPKEEQPSTTGGPVIDEIIKKDKIDTKDSRASMSVDEPLDIDNSTSGYRWFPLRPSAVGKDEENVSQVTYTTNSVDNTLNAHMPQRVPILWSPPNTNSPPPERPQPDGRDGPDIRRPALVTNTNVSQSHSVAGTDVSGQDSGSDTSVQSQPQDSNITPLDVITNSVPPVKRGPNRISELRRVPHLNSDSDTESPVSKLLGPNFRAVQQVLDRLKHDRLADSGSEEQDQLPMAEESSISGESIAVLSVGSKETVLDQTAGWSASHTRTASVTAENKSVVSERSTPRYTQNESTSEISSTLSNVTRNVVQISSKPASYAFDILAIKRAGSDQNLPHSQMPTPPLSVWSSAPAREKHELAAGNTGDRTIQPNSANKVVSGVFADNFVLPVRTSSALLESLGFFSNGDSPRSNKPQVVNTFGHFRGPRASDDVEAEGDASKSQDSSNYSQYSNKSASTDDTDDLLTYEPILEGDRHYLQMQRKGNKSDSRTPPSQLPWSSYIDVENGNETKSSSKGHQSTQTIPQTAPEEHVQAALEDNDIKSLHWSLGAGLVSPISAPTLTEIDPRLQKERSWSSSGQPSQHSAGDDSGSIQEQTLTSEYDSVTSRDYYPEILPPGKRERHPATDASSTSDELYRPVLRGGIPDSRTASRVGSLSKPVSYGIYDIRRSSGPGSTNRRRKAMGLQPKPAKEAATRETLGSVYISGSSTASSDLGSRRGERAGHEVMGSINSENHSARNVKTGDVEQTKQPTPWSGPKVRDAFESLRDVGGSTMYRYSPAEYRTAIYSDQGQSRDEPVANSTPGEIGALLEEIHGQQSGTHVTKDSTLGTAGQSENRSRSKSKLSYDSTVTSSRQDRLEKKSRGRRTNMAKTDVVKSRSLSRERTDRPISKSSRMEVNISRLSSLVSGSAADGNVSSSSQSSIVPASRRDTGHRKKPKMTSTSESSDSYEHLNFAFAEPRLGKAVEQQIRLRELLKSFRSRSIPTIARRRDSSSTESTSCLSTSETVEGPSPFMPNHRAFLQSEREFHPAAASKCSCTCSQKEVGKKTPPAQTDTRPTRDIGVNFPTPAVVRSHSTSWDGRSRGQLEDASTQTEDHRLSRDLISGIRNDGNRKTSGGSGNEEHEHKKGIDAVKREVAKTKLHLDERAVISQPSPKKSEQLSNIAAHAVARQKPEERLIPSQNSPDHVRKTASDRSKRNPFPAWFHPMTIETKIGTAAKERQQLSICHGNDDVRVDAFEDVFGNSNSLQKLTLQEALFYAKPQFVKRSQERLARVEQAGRKGRCKEPLNEETAVEKEKKTSCKTKASPVALKIRAPKTSDHLHIPKPRQMTRAEMKDLNTRLYKNLPEVKAQHEEKKRQAFYRTNRLRAQLFNKRVRNRLKGAGK